MEIIEFTDFANDAPVRALILEYMRTLPFDLSYQDPEKELGDLGALYRKNSGGALFVAMENGELAGCVALKGIGDKICEMKRMYVRPAFRGKNAGKLLAKAIVEKAVDLGYHWMNLDTDVNLHKAAISVYTKLGFRKSPAYHHIPHELMFMELDLRRYKNNTAMLTPAISPMHKKITDDLFIIEYKPEHAKAFKDLNIAWIAKSFFMEESDERDLSDPQKYFLDGGGAILLAEYKGQIVGTCALINEGHGVYELTKMAVDENFRGLKIGYHLGVEALERAKKLGAEKVVLHSNKKGSAAAIQLYYKLGFVEVPLEENAPWKRADIKMEISL